MVDGVIIAIRILLPAIVSLVAVNWVYFKVLKFAKEKNIVDTPNARKLQKEPTPVLGGMAVFFGLMAGGLCGFCMMDYAGQAPMICAAAIMFLTGLLDDMLGLTPKARLLIEALVIAGLIYGGKACIDSLHGLWGVYEIGWVAGVPLTVFACVGIINAVNMADGVNGLSSGLCIQSSVLFGMAFLMMDEAVNAMLSFTFAAALVPFLVHNLMGLRSKMFIGDAGTMLMGVLTCWFLIRVLKHDSSLVRTEYAPHVNMIAFSLAVLCVPVFDTVRVMAMRMMRGRSPFSADKTHLHHAFIKLSHSHSLTSLSEILINLSVVVLWMVCVLLGADKDVQLYVVISVSVLLVWGMYFFLTWSGKRQNWFQKWIVSASPTMRQGEKPWWKGFQQWLDAPEDRQEEKLRQRREKEDTAS